MISSMFLPSANISGYAMLVSNTYCTTCILGRKIGEKITFLLQTIRNEVDSREGLRCPLARNLIQVLVART